MHSPYVNSINYVVITGVVGAGFNGGGDRRTGESKTSLDVFKDTRTSPRKTLFERE